MRCVDRLSPPIHENTLYKWIRELTHIEGNLAHVLTALGDELNRFNFEFPGVRLLLCHDSPSVLPVLAAFRTVHKTGEDSAGHKAGAKTVEEVDAFFDRPVDITSVVIADKDGVPLAGETYHSVFDMAAVLKPKDPTKFQSGFQVKVRWKLVDKPVGRLRGTMSGSLK